jgi:4-nitrophenyl phosphatase
MQLKNFDTILLDGDGVLWKRNNPIPGIQPFIEFLEDKGVNWALLTNNNSLTVRSYLEKLAKFGIPTNERSVYTSVTATRDYLLDNFGKGASIFVVGMEAMKQTLKAAGFSLFFGEEMPDKDVVAVVAGMDLEINHAKIRIAMRLIMNGAAFIATNTDGSYPTPDGIDPGTGMVIGALQATSGKEPFVAGKPHPAIFESALKEFNSKPSNTLMVGDRMETDILGASRLGIHTAAVLTGVSSLEYIKQSEIKPDFIFENISQLHHALVKVYPS